ncbi:MAG: nucleotidyltransferase family protein [Pseudomonadota bacterium]|nr:nucleotidyltransferase family protein [Pseudomonadota bacterium]
MKALIFAAGLGERMRPLTEHTPKPLLEAGGKPLIAWQLEKLAAIGVRDVVINTSWLADRFPEVLGSGDRWDLRLHYSYEGERALETGGGMWHALDWLRDRDAPEAPFIAVNGDIHSDYDFARLPQEPAGNAHLVLVDNPPQHPSGDFALDGSQVQDRAGARLTFSGIGMYRPALLRDWRRVIGDVEGVDSSRPRFKLAPLLYAAVGAGRVTGEHHRGSWTDVGTPQRLAALDASIRQAAADTGRD